MEWNVSTWPMARFETFLLIVARVSFVLFMMPIFGSRNIPALPKVGLTLTLGLLLLPVVGTGASSFPSDPYHFGVFILSECVIGFLLGLSVKILFSGVQMAGELAGFQMGLSMAQVIDPQSGMDTTLISQFHYILALLIFLSLDGHHWFFRALVQSFQSVAPGAVYLKDGVYRHLLSLSGEMFVTAIKIAAPVMVVLILTQVALGIVAKTVPQVNVLITSFPLTIGLGLIFLALSLEFLYPHLKAVFDESGRGLVRTLVPLMAR
jgi:flagellar biosynthesis protein FliR